MSIMDVVFFLLDLKAQDAFNLFFFFPFRKLNNDYG